MFLEVLTRDASQVVHRNRVADDFLVIHHWNRNNHLVGRIARKNDLQFLHPAKRHRRWEEVLPQLKSHKTCQSV